MPASAAPIWEDLPESRRAHSLWENQDLFAAAALFDKLARAHPRHPRALFDASRAWGAFYQFPRAEALLSQLVDLGPRDGHILCLAGEGYRLLRRSDRAIACYTAALEASDPPPEAHLELAKLYERRNELASARAHADAFVALDPKHVEGRIVRSRILGTTGTADEAKSCLRGVAEDDSIAPTFRAEAWSELGRLLDTIGENDEAWNAMLAGKRLARPGAEAARRHRQRIVPALWRLAREVTAEDFRKWRAEDRAADEPPRLALMTGLPRSGTTLLERVLNAHPNIDGCDEFDFFPRFVYPALLAGTPPENVNPAHLHKLLSERLPEQRARYARSLAAAVEAPPDCAVVLDKNPSLLPLLTPYWRLAPHSPVIVALRDPRDVLVSCLFAGLSMNDFSVDFLDLHTAADRVIADFESWLVLREKSPGPWLEVRYEETVRDLPAVSRRAIEHLGLSWSEEVLRYRESGAGLPVYSPSYGDVAKPVYAHAVGRWRHYAKQLDPVLGSLQPTLRRLDYAGC